MIMAPQARKIALTAHVTCSVGSLGAVAGFFALAVTGLTSTDGPTMRGAYIAMEPLARLVIVPLVFASLVTGLVQAVGTSWGVFRHYWVIAKLLLTLFVAIVLVLQMGLIAHVSLAAAGESFSRTDLLGPRRSLVLHAGIGLLLLLVPVALSIFKPRGVTRYGWRKQQAALSPARAQ